MISSVLVEVQSVENVVSRPNHPVSNRTVVCVDRKTVLPLFSLLGESSVKFKSIISLVI